MDNSATAQEVPRPIEIPEISIKNLYREFWERTLVRDAARPPGAATPYRNAQYPLYTVQAMPRDAATRAAEPGYSHEPARIGPYRCDRYDCRGTSEAFTSWGRLDRMSALHAIYKHYRHPNLSVCRFRTSAYVEYAADLVFEIDVHAAAPEGWVAYVPFIEVAVGIGQRIFAYLTLELGISPGFITTSVTRMGARVTVDWRAFGPRRLREILSVVRYIEAQVFAEGEIARLGASVGAKATIDTAIYEGSDRPRSSDEGNLFVGPWLRPLGALHSKSSSMTVCSRTTPVPHDWFLSENARHLTQISRDAASETSRWALPELFNVLHLHPEARHPALDAHVEQLAVSAMLVELFGRNDLPEHAHPEYRQRLQQRERRPFTSGACQTELGEIDREVVESVVTYLGIEGDDRGDRIVVDCPRPACKPTDKKACFFVPGGNYNCFRCGSASLLTLASELGFHHLLPRRHQSSMPIQRIAISDVPATDANEWPNAAEVYEQEFSDLAAARAEQTATLDRFFDSNHRGLVLASGTGIGKSTAVKSLIRRRGLVARVYVGRDEEKEQYADLPNVRIIEGLRPGVNCENSDSTEAISRGESVQQTLCGSCPHRKGCPYLKQFQGIAGKTLLLHHAHAPLDSLAMFDNGASLDVIDEDPFEAAITNEDFTHDELDLLRVRRHLSFETAPEVGLDDVPEVRWAAATQRLAVILDRLPARLRGDAVAGHNPRLAATGTVADLPLARLLFDDEQLREAVGQLDDSDIEDHESLRLELLELHRIAAAEDGGLFLPRTHLPRMADEDEIGVPATRHPVGEGRRRR